jgi:hypothetical protein
MNSAENLAQKRESPDERPLEERVRVPAFDEAIKIFQKHLGREKKMLNAERTRGVLYAFLEQELDTVAMFTSESCGVSFMYSVVDSATIAKKLYRKHAGELPTLAAAPAGAAARKDFIFGPYVGPDGPYGMLFTNFEPGLRQVIRELPQALADLQNGREPVRHEIYLVGSPVRDMGRVTETFTKRLRAGEKAFDVIGEASAEFISEMTGSAPGTRVEIGTRGHSIGASSALKAAEKLLAKGAATQSRKDHETSGKPLIDLRLDSPVGQTPHSLMWRLLHVLPGALIVGIRLKLNRYKSASHFDRTFADDVAPILAEKGITTDTSAGERRRKKQSSRALLRELLAGVPVREGTQLTEVFGMFDIEVRTLKDIVKAVAANAQRPRSERRSGKKVVLSKEKERTTYGIYAGHDFPDFPPAAIEGIYQVDQSLGQLEKERSVSTTERS